MRVCFSVHLITYFAKSLCIYSKTPETETVSGVFILVREAGLEPVAQRKIE